MDWKDKLKADFSIERVPSWSVTSDVWMIRCRICAEGWAVEGPPADAHDLEFFTDHADVCKARTEGA